MTPARRLELVRDRIVLALEAALVRDPALQRRTSLERVWRLLHEDAALRRELEEGKLTRPALGPRIPGAAERDA